MGQKDMSERAKKAKYKKVSADQLLQMAAAEGKYGGFNTPNATAARREWFSFLKEEKGNDDALKALSLRQFETAISLFGGAGSSEAEDFKKAITNKRIDIIAEYNDSYGEEKWEEEVGEDGKKKNKKIAGKGAGIPENILSLLRKKKEAREIANIHDIVWENKNFQKALKEYIEVLNTEIPPNKETKKPGGGQQLKGSLENAVRGNKKKMEILRKIPVDSVFMPDYGAAPEEGPKSPPPPPPAAAGVSYREAREGNVVNLRGIAKTNSFNEDES